MGSFGQSGVCLLLVCVLLSACSPQTGQNGGSPSPSGEGMNPPAESGQPADSAPGSGTFPSKKPVPSEDPDLPYRKILESMTPDEKIGQLVVVGCRNNEEAAQMIRERKVGGVVLFRDNFENFDQLYQLTKQWKGYNEGNPLPLWIAMDEEGGTVTRLPEGRTPIPGAREVGRHEDAQLTRATGKVIGRELAAAGANLDFAPVVDVVDNPENKFMLDRSYGDTPEKVSDQAAAFLKGLKETGVQGCAKHFPGHGGTWWIPTGTCR